LNLVHSSAGLTFVTTVLVGGGLVYYRMKNEMWQDIPTNLGLACGRFMCPGLW